jgi:hypothetical protein
LKVIEKTGFLSYFLIVGDFVRYGHQKGIACVARGSAAGSLVTYLLEISNVDPIRYGLLFERFLNPERVNPPDIDIDFADDRRADVIEYVRQKYGRDAVAQIITFGTMGAKSVVRDVGRVMGLSYGECDRLAKMIPFDLKMTLEKALKQSPELKQAYENEETTRELVDTAFVLEDLTRNASVHAAGGRPGLVEDGFSWAQNFDGHSQHGGDGETNLRRRGADRKPASGRCESLRPAEQSQHAGDLPTGIRWDARFVPQIPNQLGGAYHGADCALPSGADGADSGVHSQAAWRGENRI